MTAAQVQYRILRLFRLSSVFSGLAVDAIETKAMALLRDIFAASAAWVLLFDEESKQLNVHRYTGHGKRKFHRLISEGAADGDVFQSPQPLVIDDISSLPGGATGSLAGLGIRAMIVLPMLGRFRPVGAIGVFNKGFPESYPTKAEVEVLAAFAKGVGIAIENARLHERTRRQRQRLATLVSVSDCLMQEMQLDPLLERALEKVLRVTRMDGGGLFLLNPTLTSIELAVDSQLSKTTVGAITGRGRIPLANSLIGRVAATAEPLVISDIRKDPRLAVLTATVGKQDGFRCFVSMPLILRGKVHGVLSLFSRRSRSLEADDLRLLRLIAGRISLAVDNSRLYEQTRRYARQEELEVRRLTILRQLGDRLSACIGVAGLGKQAVVGLHELLDLPLAALWVGDRHHDLRLIASGYRGQGHDPRLPPTFCLAAVMAARRLVFEIDVTGAGCRPVWIKELQALGLGKIALMHLKGRRRSVGLLGLAWSSPDPPAGNTLLGDIANSLGAAIEHARYIETLQAERDFNASVAEITRSLNSSLSLQTVLDQLCEASTRLFDISATYLWLLDAERDQLVGQAAYGHKASAFLGKRLSLDDAEAGATKVIRSQKPYYLNYAAASGIGKQQLTHQFDVQSIMVVPVIAENRAEGAMIFSETRCPNRFNDNLLLKAQVLTGHAAIAVRNARLYEHQVSVVEALQRSFLPAELPDIAGFEFGVRYRGPSRRNLIGGDFYDFVRLADGRLGIIIGDVSGKGVEAADLASLAKTALVTSLLKEATPGVAMARANSVICRRTRADQFVTLILAVLDPATGRLACINAGHPPAILYSAADRRVIFLHQAVMPFGVFGQQTYEEFVVRLAPGSAAVLYTDGLIGPARDGVLLGEDGLKRMVASCSHLDAMSMAEALCWQSQANAGDNVLDDLAVVTLKRQV